MQIAWAPIGSLKPHPQNSRKHDDKQVTAIEGSLSEFGIMRPILVDETDTILAGHGLWMAAQRRGFAEVPVLRHSHLTDVQKRAYVIADNKLAMMSAWDDSILRAELKELRTVGFDLKLVGFGDLEVVRFLNQGDAGTHAGEDLVPESSATITSRAGDVWLCGLHRICCGDATSAADVRRLLAGAKPVVMVTDPPYGVNYDPGWRHRAGANTSKRTGRVMNDDRSDWREAWALFPGDVAYVWHGGVHAAKVSESLAAAGFHIRTQIIWAKASMVLGRGDYHWQHEPCWHAVRAGKNGHWRGDRKQTSLWTIDGKNQDQETIHGTQKPVEAMRRPIINNSAEGELVYEPFLGSGTTVIAAETTGRACLAMELSPAYVDLAVRRWQQFTGRNATLEASGLEFDHVAAARAKEKPAPKRRTKRAQEGARSAP